MTWRRMGDKPLSKPMLTRFIYESMRHQGKMSQLNPDGGEDFSNPRFSHLKHQNFKNISSLLNIVYFDK